MKAIRHRDYKHYSKMSVYDNLEDIKTCILDDIEICSDRLEHISHTLSMQGVQCEQDKDVFVQLLNKTSKNLRELFGKVQILY